MYFSDIFICVIYIYIIEFKIVFTYIFDLVTYMSYIFFVYVSM